MAALKRSMTRAVDHDDAKQIADLLRRLDLVLEDRVKMLNERRRQFQAAS